MELSFNRVHYFEYEKEMMLKHQEDYGHITYHWNNVPEDILFESGFIQDYHNHRMKYKNNYLETGTYHNIYEEFGLDGIAKERDGLYHGIQCKLYDAKVGANDLGSFYHVLFMRMKRINPESKGYLYHSSDLQKSISYDFQKEGSIISCKVPFGKDKKDESKSSFELRYYQKDALKALSEDLRSPKGSLICPCGTGKTVIFNEHIKEMNYKNVFILSLYKIHALQNLNVSKEFHKSKYEYLLVDSDKEGTRDIEEIQKYMDKKTIFSFTYQSAEDLLLQLFEEFNENDTDESILKPKFDLSNSLVIVDEAHNLMNRDQLVEVLNAFPKVLFVTATPPSQMDEIIGSKLIYEYKFEKAIEDKSICDYQIYLPYVENKIAHIEIPDELKKIDGDMCKKVLFLMNGLLKSGSKRTIIYLNSIQECKVFEDVFKNVNDNYHYRKYWIKNITCDVSYEERNNILSEFSKESCDDEIKIITSVNILNECVDIVKCDSVFITNMTQNTSYIKTLQRIFRANRIDKSNPNKIAHCFIWSEDNNEILEALQLLKTNDVNFREKIKIINGDYEKNCNKKILEKIVKANMEIANYVDVKCMTLSELCKYKKQLLFEYCNKLKSVDELKNVKDLQINGLNVGSRYLTHLYTINSVDHIKYKEYSECKILKEHMDIYLKNKENDILSGNDKKELLFEYCNKEGKVPSSTCIYNGVNIGNYYINIKKKIKSCEDKRYCEFAINKLIQEDIEKMFQKREIKEKVEPFEVMADKLIEYCEKYGFPTSSTDKRLWSWIKAQRNRLRSDDIGNYKYNYLSKNDLIKEFLDKNVNEEDGKIVINEPVTKTDLWINNFTKVKAFVDKYKKIPRSVKNNQEEIELGQWVRRNKCCKNKLSDDKIEMLESLPGWEWTKTKI